MADAEKPRRLLLMQQNPPIRQKTIEEYMGEYEYRGPDGKTEVLPMNKLIARALSDILGVDYDRVIELAAKNGRYYEVIKKNVEKEEADKAQSHRRIRAGGSDIP